ncbi:response regulator transcription factor [Lewinella sp. LCG006]|uniref:response regulator transcription factor n=1 Tax=Lewinella sp. LCG006 TaxID=3231911 RepID=UPI00345F2F1A
MSVTNKILLVDDDRVLSPLVVEYLGTKNIEVTWCSNATLGAKVLAETSFDCGILDVRMPIVDGYEFAKNLRLLQPNLPFIFLTSMAATEDRIKGLLLGADDYIAKPFSLEELHLRIQVVLRRHEGASSIAHQTKSAATIEIGKYSFNVRLRELYFEGNTKKLSNLEAQLLALFCERSDGFIQRTTALHRLWQDEDQLHGRSLNVYVSKLRSLLARDPAISILNIHGVGYRLVIRPAEL